jgi:hypothetical protein
MTFQLATDLSRFLNAYLNRLGKEGDSERGKRIVSVVKLEIIASRFELSQSMLLFQV